MSKFFAFLTPSIKPGSHMPPTYLGHSCCHGLGQKFTICQALITGLPAKLSRDQLCRQGGDQYLGQIVSVINVHVLLFQAMAMAMLQVGWWHMRTRFKGRCFERVVVCLDL